MTETPANLPDVDSARAEIFQRMHVEAFFNKLASFGVFSSSANDARALLELSGKLAFAEEQPAARAASVGPYAHNPVARVECIQRP